VGADKYTAETVKQFRRRIRHIEAAMDLRDLQSPGGVKYKQLGKSLPRRGALLLNEPWHLIILELDKEAGKQIVVLEISKWDGGKG
jgi:plasmid maintenance system killer protein